MNPQEIQENRETWAQALESGGYPQTANILRDRDGYCCLGVAQQLFEPHAFDLAVRSRYRIGMGGFCSFKVSELLGLTDEDCQNFVDLNDHVGADFPRIAAEVRALPPVSSTTKIRKEI